MQTFRINKKLQVVCETGNTRNGFKHTATLLSNGNERESVKCHYYNRTWESYTYESVLEKLAGGAVLSDSERKLFEKRIRTNKWL